MRRLLVLCLLLRCSALKLTNVAVQPRDISELVPLVQKAVQAPDCSVDQSPPMAFVIHGVGACDNAYNLCTALNSEGSQIVFLNGCTTQTSLPGYVTIVEVDTHLAEHEAFNVGMDHVKKANAIVCLLRDDEMPAGAPDNTIDLWKSHARELLGANPNLGSLVCSHGFIDIGKPREIGTDDLSPKRRNKYPETRTGDDCCGNYDCGSTEEVYSGITHRDNVEAYNFARRNNFLKRRFSYLTPGWSASTQWVRKSAWKTVGGFTVNMPENSPFFEVEFQYKLYYNGLAFGQYDCELRSALFDSTPDEHEMWNLSKRFINSRLSSRYFSEFQKVAGASKTHMSLPVISSYAKLVSDASQDDGNRFKSYDFQWNSPLRSIVEEANQRIDLKYMLNKFPLRHKPNLGQLDSSLPALSDPTGDKLTLVILTYKYGLLDNLRDSLSNILDPKSRYESIVDKIIIAWNGDAADIPSSIQELSYKRAHLPVDIVHFAKNTLLNRYDTSLLPRINTQAVSFLDDDDQVPTVLEMELSFSFWRCDVRRATYMEGRQAQNVDFNVDAFDYFSTTSRAKSTFGVPRGSVVSKKWLNVYMSPQLEDLQKFVIGHPCKPDDIAFGLMINFFNRFTGAAPTVLPRVRGDLTRGSSNVVNKEMSHVEGMSGSDRWNLWRREAYVYLKHFYVSLDAHWTPNYEECYPHSTTDNCVWEISETDARNMLSHLATVCPVI
mmetsp:Transcript_73755/g.195791  ORF Transcript_73755/g.195791 Transcript_73755/m.195791 type:complete len:720 (-) Transcript_73755:144-2303(-)